MGPDTTEIAAAFGMLMQLAPYVFVPIVLALFGEVVVLLAAKRRNRSQR